MLTVALRYRYVYRPAVLVAGLVPFALLLAGAFGLAGRTLGPDPVHEMLEVCGRTALNFLLITLTVTPVRDLAGWPHVLRLRRMLGLFAFFYAALHVTIYATLELGLDPAALLEDLVERPYITVGFVAFVILLALAATSTNGMMRRLGRRWQRLHRWVYAAAVLGVWHFYWQVKADIREPLLYAGMLGVLLGYRVYRRWRTRPTVPTSRPSRPVPTPAGSRRTSAAEAPRGAG